jgi:integrase
MCVLAATDWVAWVTAFATFVTMGVLLATGTPLDPTKLTRDYMRPALRTAKITKPFRAWHGLRHTALTHNAAVNPQAYVQMRAGRSNGSIIERYIHARPDCVPRCRRPRRRPHLLRPRQRSGTKLRYQVRLHRLY